MSIDRSSLTAPRQALSLIFKQEDEFSAYQKNNMFQVRALTKIYSIDKKEEKSMLQRMFGSDAPLNQYFFGRIIGPDSPHSFLPDPCDTIMEGQNISDEEQEDVERLIALHTTFMLPEDFSASGHKIGDFYQVTLRGGENNSPFDLQVGSALRKLGDAPDDAESKALKKECENLEHIFETGGPAPNAGKIRGRRRRGARRAARKGDLDECYSESEMKAMSKQEIWQVQADGTTTELDGLWPDFRPVVEEVIAALEKRGFQTSIQTVWRSDCAQLACFVRGVADNVREGGSHSTTIDGQAASMAVDFINAAGNGWDNSQPTWDYFMALGEEAKARGMTWGGDWSVTTKIIDGKTYSIGNDPAHFEWPTYNAQKNDGSAFT